MYRGYLWTFIMNNLKNIKKCIILRILFVVWNDQKYCLLKNLCVWHLDFSRHLCKPLLTYANWHLWINFCQEQSSVVLTVSRDCLKMDLLFITALSWIFLHTAGSGNNSSVVGFKTIVPLPYRQLIYKEEEKL